MIFVDCSYSNLDYIKASILKSDLTKYFNFENVDWVEVEKLSRDSTSLITDVCKYYNDNKPYVGKSVNQICELFSLKFGVCPDTIRNYLEIGSDMKICTFKDDKINVFNKVTSSKIVYELDENMQLIKVWPTVKSIMNFYGTQSIQQVVKGWTPTKYKYKGHYWLEQEEYDKYINSKKESI